MRQRHGLGAGIADFFWGRRRIDGYVGDELVATAVTGCDDPRLRRVVMERTTYFPDRLGDAADRKRIVTPDGLEQFLARNHGRGAPDKIFKHLECLRTQCCFAAVGVFETMEVGIKLESIERVAHESFFLSAFLSTCPGPLAKRNAQSKHDEAGAGNNPV